MQPQQTLSIGGGNDLANTVKQSLMTMFMVKNMNGGGGGGGSNDMMGMIYMFVVTHIIDAVMKVAAFLGGSMYAKYMHHIDALKTTIAPPKTMTEADSQDGNKLKSKLAAITITADVSDHDNIVGQAILDYITNHANTKYVIFTKQNFILDQKDVIPLNDEIYAKMTQETTTATAETRIIQIIELFSFTKPMHELRAFLDNLRHCYVIKTQNKLGDKRFFFNVVPMSAPTIQLPSNPHKKGAEQTTKDYSRLPPNCVFTMKHFQTNRKFSNLFGEDMEIIRQRVKFFINNRKWYDTKGVPYTLGLILSGNPGTGKTSTIKCLAKETNRHIININLNNDLTKTQLENLFFNEAIGVLNTDAGRTEKYIIPLDQRIYVLEDVDCQSDVVMERQDGATGTTQSDKIDLSFLLNLLDGVLETPGRIIIMTSNFPQRLDSALIRPGRIDVIAEFTKCTNRTITQMIEFFYDTSLTPEQLEIIRGLDEYIITPAEMGKVMFENFNDISQSIKHLVQISLACKKKAALLHPELAPIGPILQSELAPIGPIVQSELAPIGQQQQSDLAPIGPYSFPVDFLAPIGQQLQTDLAPIGQTDLAPIGQTDLAPIGQTDLAPIGQTDLAPIEQSGLAPIGLQLQSELENPINLQLLCIPCRDEAHYAKVHPLVNPRKKPCLLCIKVKSLNNNGPPDMQLLSANESANESDYGAAYEGDGGAAYESAHQKLFRMPSFGGMIDIC